MVFAYFRKASQMRPTAGESDYLNPQSSLVKTLTRILVLLFIAITEYLRPSKKGLGSSDFWKLRSPKQMAISWITLNMKLEGKIYPRVHKSKTYKVAK